MLGQVGYAALAGRRRRRSASASSRRGSSTSPARAAGPAALRAGLPPRRRTERGSEAGRAAILALAKGAAPPRYGLWGGSSASKQAGPPSTRRCSAPSRGASTTGTRTGRAPGVRRHAALPPPTRVALPALRSGARRRPRPQFAAEVLRHYHASTVIQHTGSRCTSSTGSQPLQHAGPTRAACPPTSRSTAPSPARGSARPTPCSSSSRRATTTRSPASPSSRSAPTRPSARTSPAWLDRLARRGSARVHEFVGGDPRASPELPPVEAPGRPGLHTALALLTSPSPKARAWARQYARAHAGDLPAARVVAILEQTQHPETRKWASATLLAADPRASASPRSCACSTSARPPRGPKQLDGASTATSSPSFLPRRPLRHLRRDDVVPPTTPHWKKGELDQASGSAASTTRARNNHLALQAALQALGAYPSRSSPRRGCSTRWRSPTAPRSPSGWPPRSRSRARRRAGEGPCVRRRAPPTALAILGNAKLVKPRDLGLPWLLALARQADPRSTISRTATSSPT